MSVQYHDKVGLFVVGGQPVTVSPEQCAAVMRALETWHYIRVTEGYYEGKGTLGERLRLDPANPWLYTHFPRAEIDKSRLLGRLLYEGRPPLASPPPVVWSEPRYDLVEGEAQ